MSWAGIQAVAQVQAGADAGGVARLQAAQPVDQGGFRELVSAGLGEVNQQLQASQVEMQQLAVGNVQNLHQVMMRLEETRLSFQLMLQVRNRLLEAYQDLMKMQV